MCIRDSPLCDPRLQFSQRVACQGTDWPQLGRYMGFSQLRTRDSSLEYSLHTPECCSSAGAQPDKALLT
eukprot:5061340-Alexandrium_andersonii.AAC.1